MFFKPEIVASQVATLTEEAHESYAEFYSDFHKDAIGCRPRRALPTSRTEAAVEVAKLNAWLEEGSRIEKLREEVARFDFSKRMEYLMRREGLSEREAFQETILVGMNKDYSDRLGADALYKWEDVTYQWDYVCYCLGFPYTYADAFKAEWERLAKQL